MRSLLIAGTLLVSSFSVSASDFKCTIREGAFKAPGLQTLNDGAIRDPTLIGREFFVVRDTGGIYGDSLFDNSSETVEVLRNDTNDILNQVEIMSINKHRDVRLLHVGEFEGEFTFKYYLGWLGLLVVGDCVENP